MHKTPSSVPSPVPEILLLGRSPTSLSIFGKDSEHTVVNSETQPEVSPSPSDYGSIKIERTGSTYVGSSHWAAVLDSIADLRAHFANEEDVAQCRSIDPVQPPAKTPQPQLLYYSPIFEDKTSIIDTIPSRPVVDRLISRYFNVLDIATGPSEVLPFPESTEF